MNPQGDPVSQQTLTLITTSTIVASGVSLALGWWLIRRGKVTAHRNLMLAATALAAVFLVAYVTRWSLYGSKPFEGTGGWRTLYLGILLPHILLAIAVGPLALYQIYLAFKGRLPRHRLFGRITVPIWLFVAASGWAVYYLLYVHRF
jgi:putative membrane protein